MDLTVLIALAAGVGLSQAALLSLRVPGLSRRALRRQWASLATFTAVHGVLSAFVCALGLLLLDRLCLAPDGVPPRLAGLASHATACAAGAFPALLLASLRPGGWRRPFARTEAGASEACAPAGGLSETLVARLTQAVQREELEEAARAHGGGGSRPLNVVWELHKGELALRHREPNLLDVSCAFEKHHVLRRELGREGLARALRRARSDLARLRLRGPRRRRYRRLGSWDGTERRQAGSCVSLARDRFYDAWLGLVEGLLPPIHASDWQNPIPLAGEPGGPPVLLYRRASAAPAAVLDRDLLRPSTAD